jgi:hypothetical protein
MSNLKSSWQKLDDYREIKKHDNIPIVRPIGHVHATPADCPVCNRVFKDHADITSYELFQCCDECSMEWAQPNRQKWSDGWRPEQRQVDAFIKERKKLPTYVVR